MNNITEQDALMVKVESYGNAHGQLRAIAAGTAKPGITIAPNNKGESVFTETKTKFYLFPGIPALDVANDLFDLLKSQLSGGATYHHCYRAIVMGNSEVDTGLFFIAPAPNREIRVNLGLYALRQELEGDDVVLNEFRRSLEGSGALN